MFKKNFKRFEKNRDELLIKCEFYDAIFVSSGGNSYKWDETGFTYFNVRAMLGAMPTFTDLAIKYSRYKINGISFRANARSPLPSTVPKGLVPMCVAFYPSLINTDAGTGPTMQDNKIQIEPNVSVPQSKYWRFKDNYFSQSSGGYGTWNSCSDYSTIVGQVSISAPYVMSNATADSTVFDSRFTFYIKFSDKLT